MKFPNIEIRKTLALAAMVGILITLVWSLLKGERDVTLMCLAALIGDVNWYFAKSTALDKPQ